LNTQPFSDAGSACIFYLLTVHRGGLAQRVTPGKKTADAKVDE